MTDKIALIVRHQARPGQREKLRAVWEKFIKANAARNPGHLAYYFTYNQNNEDEVIAFQIFSSLQAKEEFLKMEWYPDYISEVSKYVESAPDITTASLVWSKNEDRL